LGNGKRSRSNSRKTRQVTIVPAIAKDAEGMAEVLHDAFPGESSY
jgi:hypothetical protein